jgi:GAF domain-containing protein
MDCVETVQLDGGGVTIFTDRGQAVALCATDSLSALIEELQLTLGEGPCVDASRTFSPVLVTDLTDPAEGTAGRWPAFVEQAVGAGVRSVHAFPIRVGAINLGTFDIYSRTPHTMSEQQLRAALLAVDAISAQLLHLNDGDSSDPEPHYHLVTHQAAGMLTVQLNTTIDNAMVRLRATAYAEGISINDLASDIVNGRRTFDEESS